MRLSPSTTTTKSTNWFRSPLYSHDLKLILRTVTGLLSRPERSDDVIQRLKAQVKKLEHLFSQPAAVDEGEVPHPLKLIQIHLKHTLLNSDKIKGLTVIVL